ncbi:MAG: class I SAM-dependent methyltransferase [Ilumatobacteraceae bacterium]
MRTLATTRSAADAGRLTPPDLYALYGGPEAVEHTWTRLDTWHRIEAAVLRRVFDRWLPTAPAAIADIGGGNGRWAIELAGSGHAVSLADLSGALVSDAAERASMAGVAIADRVVADARSLPWPDAAFDAALMLGPLYHLPEREERLAALREARRVVRPGGRAVIQVLHRVGALRQVVTFFGGSAGPIDWEHVWRTGTFAEAKAPPWYRSTFWHLPSQAIDEVTDAGWEVLAVQGLDGPAPEGQAVLLDADDEVVADWADQAMTLGAIPDLWATCNHLAIVAAAPA